MMNTALKRILIVVLIIFGLIAGLEFLLRAIFFFSGQKAKPKDDKNNTTVPQTQVETVFYPVLSATDFYVVGSNFFELIENEKFDQAYKLLDEGFRDEYFPTLESYISYCRKYYISKAGKEFTIDNFSKASANTYTAEGLLRDFEGSENLPAFNEYMTLRYIDEKNYRLAFRKYVLTKSGYNTIEAKGVKISILKTKLFWDKTLITAEILNSTPNPITIAKEDQLDIWIGLLDNKKKSLKRGMDLTDELFAASDFTIKPGEKAVFNFPFYTKLSEKPTALYFSNIKSGNDTIKTQLFFKELM